MGEGQDNTVRRKFFSLIGTFSEEQWLPHPRLVVAMRDKKVFRRISEFEHLTAIGLIPSESAITNFEHEKFIDEVISQARKHETPASQLIILALARPGELSEAQTDGILAILTDYLNSGEVDTGLGAFRISLSQFAKLTGVRESTTAFKVAIDAAVRQILNGRPRFELGAPRGESSLEGDLFIHISEALFQHVRHLDFDLDRKFSMLFDLMEWLMGIWPGSEAITTDIASNCFDSLPIEIACRQWRRFNEIRMRAAAK